MTSPTKCTKRFHLFGYPIAHSAAPAFHNECFKSLDLPHHFAGWSTSIVDSNMLDEIRSDESGGAAVTMPLKTQILQHLDELTPASLATKACNTIIRVREGDGSCKLVGTNTDVLGVRNSILRTLQAQHPGYRFTTNQKFPPAVASGLVIGGGATTRSAVYALWTLGLNPVFLINRDEEEVRTVVENFASLELPATTQTLELIHLKNVEDVDQHLGNGSQQEARPGLAIIVGAIPAIAPVTPAERLVYTTVVHLLTIPSTLPALETVATLSLPLPTRRIFLDMAYKPRLTPLLRIASALGWQDVGGIQAMIEQGLAQQRMWKVGSSSDDIASGDLLPADVERKARELVENMADVVPVGAEVDRTLAIVSR